MTDPSARRWTAHKGWRWMPGMLLEDRFGDTWRCVFAEPGWFARVGDGFREYRDGHHVLVERGPCVPVPSDPATRGCLLELVRESWKDPTLYPVRIVALGLGVDHWSISTANGPEDVAEATETDALLAVWERGPASSWTRLPA